MIEIKNLSFSYTGDMPYIINDINLNISKGTYTSIIGKNGSCKSTLVKLILKLLKPCKGSINIGTNKIGYVPQRIDTFNSQFPITVNEILKCHMHILKIKNKDIIDKSLDSIGMLDFKNHLIGNLSGGQQQKIFIARALMGEPELLILDEPSTGVDIKSQNEIYSFIKELNINKQITVISVEHNMEAALKNSSHIIKMQDAKALLYDVSDYRKIINTNALSEKGLHPKNCKQS
ncbi:High-affinity zinc uptake system ATP-binding protein ZnuC [Clostridium liquoris]|uniref:High-affinity zinc uptake system ATP-binding protein ZnuC n=1 Tax=Clostridium liquoris TaxID=1289519 RepID=A0A2T0B5E7_9CLOT|nr:metal ABC transporter ATP-binding protein [Clostridium liquoris]PRR79110.1 High-affinity zinc uptake system ATP-binding protein ZnuC [Clostridium liquoris]